MHLNITPWGFKMYSNMVTQVLEYLVKFLTWGVNLTGRHHEMTIPKQALTYISGSATAPWVLTVSYLPPAMVVAGR